MTTTFIETPRFPEDISYGSVGGPEYLTNVVEIDSGALIRNSVWTYGRHSYDVAYGVKTQSDLETLLNYFHMVLGRGIGFRYKDWLDYKSCVTEDTPAFTDCNIGTGTGALATFQLRKGYTVGGTYYTYRNILKPVTGTVKVGVAGVQKTQTTHWNVNTTTGIITFTAGNIPGAGAAVTAGFEFDVPVAFASDRLNVNLNDYKAAMAQVALIELKYGDT